MIPENGVEDREKLPHHGNEGDLLGSVAQVVTIDFTEDLARNDGIGTILALIARSAGAGFVAVGDVIDEPLRRLADLGVDETINVATEADRLARHAEGKGTFDIVFEASGSAGATISALDVVKPRGTIVCVGQGAWPEINMSAIVTKEINVIGSFRFDEEFDLAINYIARNRAQIRALLTATVPASEPTPAFDLAADKSRSVKVHLQF